MQAVSNTGRSGVLVLKVDEDDVNTVLMSIAKQDNYKKERTETALSFHFSDFGMRGYISMVKPSGLFLRFSFSF